MVGIIHLRLKIKHPLRYIRFQNLERKMDLPSHSQVPTFH